MGGELLRRAREIDAGLLGRRIREARLDRGLTQTALGAEDASKAYVSRIEDGQRRPSPDLLSAFAARLGVSVETLLAGDDASEPLDLEARVLLDHAELHLATGDAPAALEVTRDLLGRLDQQRPLADLRRAILVVHAGALEATGDLPAAIAALEELGDHVVPDETWLRTSIALCRCHRETGDLARSIKVGERASARAAELGIGGLTEAIQLTVTVAGAYVLRGELTTALRLCQEAIAAAREFDSPLGMASAYWNASLIELRRGAPSAALAMARRALVVFEASDDARNLAKLQAQIANIQLLADPPDPTGALATLDDAETGLRFAPSSPTDNAGSRLTRARALHMLGRNDDALLQLDTADALAPDDAPLLLASVAVLRGRLALAAGDAAGGRVHFESAVRRLSGAGSDLDAARIWFDLGDLLTEVGESVPAADAYRRAAASAGVLGSGLQRSRTPL